MKGGDLAWMMVSSALVLLMVPGLGLFYSGVSEKCSALSMMWLSMMTTSIVGVQVPCHLNLDSLEVLTNQARIISGIFGATRLPSLDHTHYGVARTVLYSTLTLQFLGEIINPAPRFPSFFTVSTKGCSLALRVQFPFPNKTSVRC